MTVLLENGKSFFHSYFVLSETLTVEHRLIFILDESEPIVKEHFRLC